MSKSHGVDVTNYTGAVPAQHSTFNQPDTSESDSTRRNSLDTPKSSISPDDVHGHKGQDNAGQSFDHRPAAGDWPPAKSKSESSATRTKDDDAGVSSTTPGDTGWVKLHRGETLLRQK